MNSRARASLLLALLTGAFWTIAGTARPTPPSEMAAAAASFLDSLTPELREKAAFAFDSNQREDWHYVPRRAPGLEFSEMNEPQKIAARTLMRSTLSSHGTNKVEQIMLLDSVLRDIEKGSGPRRDPLAYSVAVFGTPGNGPWGWKLEGHHISLNFTSATEHIATTPSFLGANPAEVRTGDRAGLRVLAAEEDIARELLSSLTPEERKEAIIGDKAPADVLAVPGRSLAEIDAAGLPFAKMDVGQKVLVQRLLGEFAGNLRFELAERELERIRDAGIDKVRFAWMGGELKGQGHYYRLSGPTFVIEYDNTQNDANHVHTVWRDRERDFGRDQLKEHIEHDHRDSVGK